MFQISNIYILTKKNTENTFGEPLTNRNSQNTLVILKIILMNGWFWIASGATMASEMGTKNKHF